MYVCSEELELFKNDPAVKAAQAASAKPSLDAMASAGDIEKTLNIPVDRPEVGRVVAVLGAVVDIQFPTEDCPDENDAIEVIIRDDDVEIVPAEIKDLAARQVDADVGGNTTIRGMKGKTIPFPASLANNDDVQEVVNMSTI